MGSEIDFLGKTFDVDETKIYKVKKVNKEIRNK